MRSLICFDCRSDGDDVAVPSGGVFDVFFKYWFKYYVCFCTFAFLKNKFLFHELNIDLMSELTATPFIQQKLKHIQKFKISIAL